MSQPPEDAQRAEGDLPPDPTAADWSPLPGDATQPIDPSVTDALPVQPPPSSPQSPPGLPRAPSNPYAAPAASPPGGLPPYPYGSPPPYVPPAPTADGPAEPPNPYAANPPPPSNPYASGNPYGSSSAPGLPPVGLPPYGYQQVPERQTNVSAIVLLILSGLMFCCVVQIPATILAIVALTKQNADPQGSRRLTKYGWIAFGVGIVLAVVVVAIIAASGASFDGTPSDGYSY